MDAPRSGPPELLLGPLLRYVDDHSATIWVETDRPATVRVLDVSEPTWSVHGHHFALLVLTGLPAGTEIEYEVHLDDVAVWPEPGSPMPPSVIRTFSPTEDFRLSFGSCRRSAGDDAKALKQFGADALVALARRMRTLPHNRWPDAIFMGGDQVYADMPSPEQREKLLAKHNVKNKKELDAADELNEVADEIQTFEEYTWLYHDSWGRPDVRWLLSTVPTVMLLDDHDLRDDWNTSQPWREEMSAKKWWRERVLGAFVSYWVYQHLGNLSPRELAEDRMYTMVRTVMDEDERNRQLDEFAWEADANPARAQWSIKRELGTGDLAIRLVAIDSRCSRVLDPARRAMLDEEELDWFREAVSGPVDHLLIGTTLPVLTVPGLHHLEGWNEALAGGRYGRRVAHISEKLRQKVDLEHWSAFRRTFIDVMETLAEVGTSPKPPASMLLLSGDVHCSYIAEGRMPGVDPARTSFQQLTMSPFRNPLEPPIRVANRLLSLQPVRKGLRKLADLAGVPRVPAEWRIDRGLWFDNGVMTLVMRGRRATVEVDHAHVVGTEQVLRRTDTVELTA